LFQSGEVRAYDSSSALVWRFRLPGTVSIATPGGSLVVAGSRILTQYGDDLIALDPGTGTLLSSRRMPGSFLLRNAAVTSDRAYVQTTSEKGRSVLHAHDIASCSDVWAQTVAQRMSELAVAGSMLCGLTGDRGGIVGVDPATGQQGWRTSVEDVGRGFVDAVQGEVPGEVLGRLRVGDRALFAGVYLHHIVAIEPRTGEILWASKVPMPAPVNCAATPAGRIDVISSGSYASLDAATGRVVREESLRGTPGVGIDPGYLAFDGRMVYAAEEPGTVFAFDTVNGRLAWTHAVGARVPLSLPPRLGAGRLFITDSPEGRLHAFVLT